MKKKGKVASSARRLSKREQQNAGEGRGGDFQEAAFDAAKDYASRNEKLQALFNWEPTQENPALPSLEAVRVGMLVSPVNMEFEQKRFEFKTEYGKLTCEYFAEKVRAELARHFDNCLAQAPSQIALTAEKEGISYEEASNAYAHGYAESMAKCLDHAMELFEKRFSQVLWDAFPEFVHEILAETINSLNQQLRVQLEEPRRLFKLALDHSTDRKKRRMDSPSSGRPPGWGRFASEEEFLDALRNAGWVLLWLGQAVTQKNIVKVFHDHPAGLWRLAEDESGEVQLRGYLKEAGIDWKNDFVKLLSLPDGYSDWAEKNFADLKNRIKFE